MTTDDRLVFVERRLATVEAKLDELGRDHREMMTTLQGPPHAESIRGRLHKLEDDRTAAMAGKAAVDAARMMRQQSAEKRFSRREKLAGLLLAAAVLVPGYLNLLHSL